MPLFQLPLFTDFSEYNWTKNCTSIQVHLKKLEYLDIFFFFYLFQKVKLSFILDSLHVKYLLFFETTIMGKTADLAMVQKTIIDTLHKEGKSQKVITERGGCSQSAVSKHIKCKVDWKEEIG